MRLFVAIELDEPFRNHLIKLQESLRTVVPRVSFTRPENLHLTLKFIGEVEEPRIPALCEALNSVPRDGPLPLRYVGLDLLPEPGPIRIIAAGVDGGEKLLSLQKQIKDVCAKQNIPRENRRFRAHITLARAREGLPRSAQPGLFESVSAANNIEMPVEQFVLMQSKLSNKGSEYTPIHHVHL
jgi:2'-5' RNA ligase